VTSARALFAFLRRDLRQWGSYRFAAALQLAGIFFQLSVFFFIGEALDIRDPAILRYSAHYFDYVVVGIGLAGFISVSLSGLSAQIREAQISGTLEALLVTPVPVAVLVLGTTAWDYLGAFLRFVATLALAAMLFQTPLHAERIPAAALVMALVIAAFAGIGLLSAAFVMVFKRGDPFAQGITWFAMLFGGVYFPVSASGDPALVSAAGWIPITPALDALRDLLLRGATFAEVAPAVLRLAALAAVLLPLGLAGFAFGLRRARVNGSLTHY